MTDLKDLTAIITGASSGIGEATARELATHGVKVMLAARRTERLQTLQADIEQHGGVAESHATDVTDRNAVQALADETVRTFGKIDVLFNNAGLMPLSMLDKLRIDEWDQMIDVNIKGVLYGIAAVLPQMRKQGSGHIINCASVAGHKVFPGAAVYCATKHAVRALSEGLRAEAGSTIRTTIISPGAVKTELDQSIKDPEMHTAMQDVYKFAIQPDAIARAVRFAIEQPPEVDVNEILVRPVAQPR